VLHGIEGESITAFSERKWLIQVAY
jgi:hypothetical protein